MKLLTSSLILLTVATANARREIVPPELSFKGHFKNKSQEMKAAIQVSQWTPDEKNNPWEMSGLFEGDIMLPKDHVPRNGMEDLSKRWPQGVVPYFIENSHFSQNDKNKIILAMKEFHRKTCIRFRPFKPQDPAYIWIKGERQGCWSYVGRIGTPMKRGQQVNLQPPNCLIHGTIVHELLHALGFYHQQSDVNRDRYIRINWPNIMRGMEENFKKHPTKSYGVSYDYNSIMHYSSFALSRNGQPTIVPLDKTAKIGQRVGLSKKDVQKLLNMYRCRMVKGKWLIS